jgi:ADP-heptose:LPS heptosyltransferase
MRPKGEGPHHALEVLLPFATILGAGPKLEFPLQLRNGNTFAWRSFFEGDPSRTFVIFTDSRGAGKEWPNFTQLMTAIFESIPESRIAWCAGKPSEPSFAPPADRWLNLTGCSLEEMIALVRQPSVFVGNDSGPMHLSAASGNRVLAIFGPTSARRFGPFPLECPRHATVTAPDGQLNRLEASTVLAALGALRRRG